MFPTGAGGSHLLRTLRIAPLIAATAGLGIPTTAGSISLDLIDDFQDQTRQSWVGAPLDPGTVTVEAGGRGGAQDFFLQVVEGGSASRLVTFNQDQWAGDYTGEGVARISAYLNNLGTTALTIRLGLDGLGGRFSTDGVALDAGSGWQRVEFSVLPEDLIACVGASCGTQGIPGTDPDATLGDAFELRLLHRTTPGFVGDAVVGAVLGIDDVTALPEPSQLLQGGAALLALAALGRRSRRTGPAVPSRP